MKFLLKHEINSKDFVCVCVFLCMLLHFRTLQFKLCILIMLLAELWLKLHISFWPVTTKAWIQVQASSYGICGVCGDTGMSLCLSASVFPCQCHISSLYVINVYIPPSVIPSHEALMLCNLSN